MSALEILTEFKKNLICFMDELIEQFPTEGDLIMLRIFIKDQAIIADVINNFTHKINTNNNELRKMIKDRNENFFLNHSMFDLASKNKINHFKKIWRSGCLDKEDKETIWNWVDSFVYLSDKYEKNKNI